MNAKNNDNTPSSWGFFGYDILYAIPIIGTIFLIKHSFDNTNPARRNFARSKFIPFLIWGIVIKHLPLLRAEVDKLLG